MGDINWKDKCWVTTVFLVRPDRKVLLTWNKNLQTWIPVGGHIEVGETPDAAAKREVFEETEFDFEFFPKPEQNDKALLLRPFTVQIEKMPHHNIHINVVFFGKCTKWSDKAATDEEEKLRWFSLEELEKGQGDFLPSVYASAVSALKTVRF